MRDIAVLIDGSTRQRRCGSSALRAVGPHRRGTSYRVAAILVMAVAATGCGLDAVGPDLNAWKAAQADSVSDATVAEDTSHGGDSGGTSDGADACEVSACDDGDPCTSDTCAAGACVHSAASGPACDDGQLCTSDDACVDGTCEGKDKDCDDHNGCTVTACDPGKGDCVTLPVVVTACDDGDPCTVDDPCDAGVCSAGAAKGCDDANACTTDGCDGTTGACTALPLSATACDDGDACRAGESCEAGACQGGAIVSCDDANVCTIDSCDKVAGCQHSPLANGSACSDGSSCTVQDGCSKGSCVGVDVGGAKGLGTFAEAALHAVAVTAWGSVAVGYARAQAGGSDQPWLVTVHGATGAIAQQMPADLPSGTKLYAVADLLAVNSVTAAVGVAPVQDAPRRVVVARWDEKGLFLGQESLEMPQPSRVHAATGGAWHVDEGATAPLLIVGATDITAATTRAMVWRRAPAGGLSAVPAAMPHGELRAVAAHPAGAVAGGGVQLAGAERPAAALIDRAGAIIRWQPLEEQASGRVSAITSIDRPWTVAAGVWSGNGAQTPVWWGLDPKARVLWRSSLPNVGGAVVAAANAAPRIATLLLQGASGGSARLLRVSAENGRVMDNVLLAAAEVGTAPTGVAPALPNQRGWVAIGVSGGGGKPWQAHLTLRHAFLAADCGVAGACGGRPASDCVDESPCTDDRCDPGAGCVHDFHQDPCLDGQACAIGAACASGSCTGGATRLGVSSAPIDRVSDGYAPLVAAAADGGAFALLRGMAKIKGGVADLVRYDAKGIASWSVAITPDIPANSYPTALVPRASEVAIIGTRVDPLQGQSFGAWWLVTHDGKLAQFTMLDKLEEYTTLLGAASAWDATTVAVGAAHPKAASGADPLLLRIDAKGAMSGKVALPVAAGQKACWLDAVVRRGAGGYWAAGVCDDKDGARQLLVARVGEDLSLQSQRLGGTVLANAPTVESKLLELDRGIPAVLVMPSANAHQLRTFEPVDLGLVKTWQLTALGVTAPTTMLRLADGTVAVAAREGNQAVVRAVFAADPSELVVGVPGGDAVALATAATVLVRGDIFAVTQVELANGSRVGIVARAAPSGATDCAVAGLCGTHAARTCDTGLECRPLSCSAGTCGSGLTPPVSLCMGASCGDGHCAALGTCEPVAQTGPAALCDDGDDCTVDACLPTSGCVHTTAADGSPCDDGKKCSVLDMCTKGKCGGTPAGCKDP